MFITPAYAQAAGAASNINDILVQIAPFGIVLVIFYFLLLRPQQKRARDQADMLSKIGRGDTVVTTGGIIGKVTKDNDPGELEIEIAPNVKIRVLRQMITEVRGKNTPAKA
jgi:preprotein translocase subunit YajC